MLECNVMLTLFCTYIYLRGNIYFICLIQIQNTEIYTAYRKSAQKYRDSLLISPSPKHTPIQ